jgi:hypothetical protein
MNRSKRQLPHIPVRLISGGYLKVGDGMVNLRVSEVAWVRLLDSVRKYTNQPATELTRRECEQEINLVMGQLYEEGLIEIINPDDMLEF